MSDQINGQVWVDPDGVVRAGDHYAAEETRYAGYLKRIEDLRHRYAGSWGDDEMGQQFSQKFLEGLDSLEQLTAGVQGTLAYTAEGLRQSGQQYEQANDDAAAAAGKLVKRSEAQMRARQHAGTAQDGSQPRELKAFTREPGDPADRAQRDELGLTALTRGPADAENRAQRDERGLTTFTRETREAVSNSASVRGVEPRQESSEQMYELLPHDPDQKYELLPHNPDQKYELLPYEPEKGKSRVLYDPETVADSGYFEPTSTTSSPGQPFGALEHPAAMAQGEVRPATSASYPNSNYLNARVDGAPIPDGYQLQAFHPASDGKALIDANLYDSVTAVRPDQAVVGADGTPVDSGGRPVLMVRPNPNVDPTAPGYQPLYLTAAPDGTIQHLPHA